MLLVEFQDTSDEWMEVNKAKEVSSTWNIIDLKIINKIKSFEAPKTNIWEHVQNLVCSKTINFCS